MNSHPPAPHTPAQLRRMVSAGTWTGPTDGILDGYQQANLVVVPGNHAADFETYCARNPRVCPLLARTAPGDPLLTYNGCIVDIRTDLPRYRVWEGSVLVDEPTELDKHWRDDSVAFALGCSFTFDGPLRRAGIGTDRVAPAAYITTRPVAGVGVFHGPLVVSMRPVRADLLDVAVAVTSRYPTGHGAPVHIGDPAALGIDDLTTPDFGIFPGLPDGYEPVFWACGVTPQLALGALDQAMTHYPGHMLVLDTRVEEAVK